MMCRALAALTFLDWTMSTHKIKQFCQLVCHGSGESGRKLFFSLGRENWIVLSSCHHEATNIQKNQKQLYLNKLKGLHCINTLFFAQQEFYFNLSLSILEQHVSTHLG